MKKAFLTLTVLCAVAMMAGCKSGAANEDAADSIIGIESTDTQHSKGGLEHDWQLMLLGEWKVVRLDRRTITSGKERNDTVVPNLIWRFNDDGYYYETAWHHGDTNTYQYGYTLRNDSIMLREDSGQWNPWLRIDMLSQESMALTNVDPSEHDTIVTTLTLKRIPMSSPMKQL